MEDEPWMPLEPRPHLRVFTGVLRRGDRPQRLAIFWLIDRASPQFVALGNYMMPIGNIILAMAVLGEVLAPGQYLGTLVILVGMALSNGGRGR